MLVVRHFPIVDSPEKNGHPVEDQVGDILCREAAITWRKLFETEIPEDTRIYLVGIGENMVDLKETVEENLRCKTTIANPYARVLLKHVGRPRVDISIAEGLALKTLAPDHIAGINFLEADSIKAKSTTSPKKEIAVCAVLIAAIAAVSLIGLFMRRSQLENKYEDIRSEINENFRRALPQERIVNPLAQLDQKLQAMQEDYALFGPALGAGVRPLEVLNVITDSTPEDTNIGLEDLLITTEKVRLTGTAESFESAYEWQRLLEQTPQLSGVEVVNPQQVADGKLVHFVVQASITMKDRG
jgi:Tfp pilus assembly protein PilN